MDDFREHLREARYFAILYSVILALGLTAILVVGTSLGDCDPGPGCHDNDDAIIGSGLVLVLAITLAFGSAIWFLFSTVHRAAIRHLRPLLVDGLLYLLVILALLISFWPATELLLLLG